MIWHGAFLVEKTQRRRLNRVLLMLPQSYLPLFFTRSLSISGSLPFISQYNPGRSSFPSISSIFFSLFFCSKCFNKSAHQAWRCGLRSRLQKYCNFGTHELVRGTMGVGANLVTMFLHEFFLLSICRLKCKCLMIVIYHYHVLYFYQLCHRLGDANRDMVWRTMSETQLGELNDKAPLVVYLPLWGFCLFFVSFINLDWQFNTYEWRDIPHIIIAFLYESYGNHILVMFIC